MKHIIQKLIIMMIFILKINIIKCKRPVPWFMDNEFIYYVDIEQKYTSNFTQKECLRQQMIDMILKTDVRKLLPPLKRIYGDVPGVWTFNNEFYSTYYNDTKKCYGLHIQESGLKPTECSNKMGFICKKRMKHAYLYAQNSLQKLEGRNIKKFCDPQASKDHNNNVVACLIEFLTGSGIKSTQT